MMFYLFLFEAAKNLTLVFFFFKREACWYAGRRARSGTANILQLSQRCFEWIDHINGFFCISNNNQLIHNFKHYQNYNAYLEIRRKSRVVNRENLHNFKVLVLISNQTKKIHIQGVLFFFAYFEVL
jgi:hypothetical protein